ncbi:MAG: hypothetical protein M3552_04810 [Planctomycetota bacterium]|nr:hypothetical protein [Planctomycetaceae bacterium]MDQ3329960.1 hypothetical protein [Planctomycetota bacterium]
MKRNQMNCDETRRHWDVYHDSEGDAELYLQMNEHLAECPGCAEWFHQQSRLEDLLSAKLRGATAPSAELWQNVLMKSKVTPVASPKKRFPLAPLLLVAASVLALLSVWASVPTDGPSLSQLTAAEHEAFSRHLREVDYASQSDLEVEDYLQRRVSFPVRCPPRSDTGFHVRGAGLCRLDGSEAAYLVGKVGDAPVSIFILPRAALAAFPHQRKALAREATHRCREGAYDMIMAEIDQSVVLIIGDAEPKRLERVLRAYGTYPHAGNVGPMSVALSI